MIVPGWFRSVCGPVVPCLNLYSPPTPFSPALPPPAHRRSTTLVPHYIPHTRSAYRRNHGPLKITRYQTTMALVLGWLHPAILRRSAGSFGFSLLTLLLQPLLHSDALDDHISPTPSIDDNDDNDCQLTLPQWGLWCILLYPPASFGNPALMYPGDFLCYSANANRVHTRFIQHFILTRPPRRDSPVRNACIARISMSPFRQFRRPSMWLSTI